MGCANAHRPGHISEWQRCWLIRFDKWMWATGAPVGREKKLSVIGKVQREWCGSWEKEWIRVVVGRWALTRYHQLPGHRARSWSRWIGRSIRPIWVGLGQWIRCWIGWWQGTWGRRRRWRRGPRYGLARMTILWSILRLTRCPGGSSWGESLVTCRSPSLDDSNDMRVCLADLCEWDKIR